MSEERLVPKLRFSGFDNNYTYYKLNQLIKKISSGKTNIKEKQANGKYPIFGSRNIIGYSNSFDYDGDYILIARVGANAGTLYKVHGKCGVSDNTLMLETNELINKNYLYYYLKQYNLNRLIFGSGQPLITGKQLKKINLNIPAIKEQNKIANFLLEIDKKIELLAQKHHKYQDFKKYLMQQIFAQKLRFADFADDWVECKFKDLGTVKSGVGFSNKYQGHTDLKYNVYKVSDMNLKGNEKIMNKSNNTIDDEILSEMGAKLIDVPSIIFAKVGEAIFLNRKRIAKPNFLIDNNMMAFSPNKTVNLEFMYYLSTTINFGKYAQTGALPSYNASDIYSIKCKIPSIEEQEKIVNILSLTDNKIDFCSNQIRDVLNFKKGLLQQMFV